MRWMMSMAIVALMTAGCGSDDCGMQREMMDLILPYCSGAPDCR